MSDYTYFEKHLVGLFFVFLPLFLLTACSNNVQNIPVSAEFEQWIPGTSNIKADYMKAHEVAYEKAGYRMRYVVSSDNYRGVPAWKFEIYFEGSGNGKPDTIYLAKNNLAFLGRLLPMPQYTIDVHFDDGEFKGSLTPAEESEYQPVAYLKSYPHGGFEPAIINYAIAALPLEVGFKASIPVFDLNNGSEMFWSNIEVLAKEQVEINGKNTAAFKVLSKGIKNKTIWISMDFPFALKMTTEGSFGTWEVTN